MFTLCSVPKGMIYQQQVLFSLSVASTIDPPFIRVAGILAVETLQVWPVALPAPVLAVLGHIIKEGRLEREGCLQKSLHKLYAVSESLILKVLGWMMKSKLIGEQGREAPLQGPRKGPVVPPPRRRHRLRGPGETPHVDRVAGGLAHRDRPVRVQEGPRR